MDKIIIVTCWYGEYPWYLPYYLNSCKYNSTIDFVIITDNDKKVVDLPDNVKIIYKNLSDIVKSTSEKLGFQINIDYPYKLCDFKPAYAFMFPDIITKDYDFWGHSDLDIIYGRIRQFLTSDFLNNYDYISLRHDYTTGCFGLYRNNEILNNYFKRSKDYRKVFANPEHYCFDECNFLWDHLIFGGDIFDIPAEIESFTHLIKQAELNKELRTHFDFILLEGFTGKITFNRGKIYFKKKYEGILFHLFWLKKRYNPDLNLNIKVPKKYRISPTKIY